MAKYKQLWDLYRFPGFSPEHTLFGLFGDPRSRIMVLTRRGKKLFVAAVAGSIIPTTTGKSAGFATCPVERYGYTWKWRSAEWRVESVGK
jgi:hypothetical protein